VAVERKTESKKKEVKRTEKTAAEKRQRLANLLKQKLNANERLGSRVSK
jgi:hypothetical protein